MILYEGDIDLVILEIVNDKDLEKSDNDLETRESIEETKFPLEDDDGGIFILDDLNEKEMNIPRVQAMFKRSRHKKLSTFIVSQNGYELSKRKIRADDNVYHIFKPNTFRDVQKVYQDKASMDMTLNEFNYLASTDWSEKY